MTSNSVPTQRLHNSKTCPKGTQLFGGKAWTRTQTFPLSVEKPLEEESQFISAPSSSPGPAATINLDFSAQILNIVFTTFTGREGDAWRAKEGIEQDMQNSLFATEVSLKG